MIIMAKDKPHVRKVNLDRVYTHSGRHFGPGMTEVRDEKNNDQKVVDKIADDLEKSQARLQRKEQADLDRTRRRDRAVTGVRERGTDAYIDNGPRARRKEAAAEDETETDDETEETTETDEEDDRGETFTFKGEELLASDLWDKDDDELKEGGLKKKQVKRIRQLQDEDAETQE